MNANKLSSYNRFEGDDDDDDMQGAVIVDDGTGFDVLDDVDTSAADDLVNEG